MKDLLGKIGIICMFSFVVFGFWKNLVERHDSYSWLESEAVITRSYIKEVTSESASGSAGYSNLSSTHYSLVISYEYEMNGVKYKGDRVKVGGLSFATEAEAVIELEKYQPGEIVAVYYDPEKPFKSVLIRG